MLEANVRVPWAGLDDFARSHPILRLAFFGSVLRDDFGPESDIDILVWLDEDARISYFALCAMESELCGLFGRKVDLRTPAELSRYFCDEVIAGCHVFFEAAGA
jgi:predicted nucleotidyltransferase